MKKSPDTAILVIKIIAGNRISALELPLNYPYVTINLKK